MDKKKDKKMNKPDTPNLEMDLSKESVRRIHKV